MAERPLSFLERSPLQKLLVSLGKYLLGIEISHSTGRPMPVLKLILPTEWLIPEHDDFIVEAEFFSNEENIYSIGVAIDSEGLDELFSYTEGIIKYNDAVEAKKIELAELLRQKELMLEQSISDYKAKMESSGIKFREISVRKPEAKPVLNYQSNQTQFNVNPINNSSNNEADDDDFWADEFPDRNLKPAPTMEDMMLTPLEPSASNSNPNGSLSLVAPQVKNNRNEVQIQQHDNY